ncbi:MAG: galactokinase [Gemmatimonadetes bacterium]|nr:galactokinase [Gemmatimonadota bacterium]
MSRTEGIPEQFRDVSARMAANGLTAGAADGVAELAALCASALRDWGTDPEAAACAFFVPGRVEVLGKHTDYAGGRSLLAALERGVCAVGVPRRDGQIRMVAARTGERATFPFSADLEVERAGWQNYAMTVARRVAKNFPGAAVGADIAFAGNLPIAAGMSSGSAFAIMNFLVLSAVNDLESRDKYRRNITSREDLADYLSGVENGLGYKELAGQHGVGTLGGSEDHTSILCGRAGELVQYRFAPVHFERAIPFPADYTFAFASSGVQAEKAGAALERYNRLSRRTREITAAWNAATGRDDRNIAAAVRSSPDAAASLRRIIGRAQPGEPEPAVLRDRLEQFLTESDEIIPAAGDALAARRLDRFAELVARSQALAETMLRNQVEETVHLVRSAESLGALASSAFGAGFGGSVWAIVEISAAEKLIANWRSAYLDRFPEKWGSAEFFASRPSPPAQSVL